jgi:hypothetical protein
MTVILSWFDLIIGPRPYIIIPGNFDDSIANEISRVIDLECGPGEMFVKIFNEIGLKSYNLQFKIPSEWARGKFEVVQLSVFTSEEVPPEKMLKSLMEKCRDNIIDVDDIYKGFYVDMDFKEKEREKINEKHQILVSMIEWLDDAIKTGLPSTSGYISSSDLLCNNVSMNIPASFINRMKERTFSSDKKSMFIVFKRGEEGTTDVKMVPVSGSVFKIKIITEKKIIDKDVKLLLKLRGIIMNEMIFTTGLCYDKSGKCTYEAYFLHDDDFTDLSAKLAEKLSTLDFIGEFVLSPVDLLD